MKIRNDFVTNSSSSSFILAFKDEDDFSEFEEECKNHGYEAVARLARRVRKIEERTIDEIRKETISSLYHWLTLDEKRDYLNKQIPNKLSFSEKMKQESLIESSPEFQEHMNAFIITTDFSEKKQQIEESEILINATIWDSNGGLLEFAIRNGLLKEWAFSKWFISQLDVG